MASFFDDQVRLKLDGHEVPIVSRYRVASGVMQVPSAFSLTVGHGGLFRNLASAFPVETPFELYVGDRLVQTGELDAIQNVEVATEAQLRGRDPIRRLVDCQISSERTFSEKTFFELTQIALDDVGLGDRTIFALNDANRLAITGTQKITLLSSPATEEGQETIESGEQTAIVYKTIKAKLGRFWWDFLSENYRRAGLFLWADRNGAFVLSRPNGNQEPIYRIIRKQTGQADASSVLGKLDFSFDISHMYSEYLVAGRTGGGKNGRSRFLASYVDDMVVAILNPNLSDRANGGTRKKRLVIEDEHVVTQTQAKLLARRKCAEARRNGWKLSYRVSGHTAPALKGGGRIAWAPDTVVYVVDDEMGIEGPMYIYDVEFSADPQKSTMLRLMRCEDLIFAEEAAEAPKHQLVDKPGVVPTQDPNVKIHLDNKDFWHVVPVGSGS